MKKRLVNVCTYDNPNTMARECWEDGKLFCSYDYQMCLPSFDGPTGDFFFGANIGPWETGQIVGKKEALPEFILLTLL